MSYLYDGENVGILIRVPWQQLGLEAMSGVHFATTLEELPPDCRFFPFCEDTDRVDGNEHGLCMVNPHNRKKSVLDAIAMLRGQPNRTEPVLSFSFVDGGAEQVTVFSRMKHVGAVVNAGADVFLSSHGESITLNADGGHTGNLTMTASDGFRSFWSLVRWSGMQQRPGVVLRTLLSCLLSGIARRKVRVTMSDDAMHQLAVRDQPSRIYGAPTNQLKAVMRELLTVSMSYSPSSLADIKETILQPSYRYGGRELNHGVNERDLWGVPWFGIAWTVAATQMIHTSRTTLSTARADWPAVWFDDDGHEDTLPCDYDSYSSFY